MLYNDRATNALKNRPTCNARDCQLPAVVDAKTRMGPWGYFCTYHFNTMCPGKLGMGIGQYLLCDDDWDAKLIKILKSSKP